MTMDLALEMIALAVLAVLYGLAWHDQPANEAATTRNNSRE